MQQDYLLALACLAMMLLSFAVAVRMFLARVTEMKAKRIHPQSIATSQQSSAALQSKMAQQAADNYKNLFEMPVLFYLLSVLLLALHLNNWYFVAGAWMYVFCRISHSYIHCTYNKVMHRFKAFIASVFILFVLCLGFAVQLLIKVS